MPDGFSFRVSFGETARGRITGRRTLHVTIRLGRAPDLC